GSRQMTWILLPRSFRGFTMTCCFRFLAISGLPARPTPSLEIVLDGIEDDFFHGSLLVCSLDLEFDPDGLGQVDCGALGQPLLLGSRCFPASHNHRYSVMVTSCQAVRLFFGSAPSRAVGRSDDNGVGKRPSSLAFSGRWSSLASHSVTALGWMSHSLPGLVAVMAPLRHSFVMWVFGTPVHLATSSLVTVNRLANASRATWLGVALERRACAWICAVTTAWAEARMLRTANDSSAARSVAFFSSLTTWAARRSASSWVTALPPLPGSRRWLR